MTEQSIEPDERGLVVACPKCGRHNRMVYDRLGQKFRCAQCHTELSLPNEPISRICFESCTIARGVLSAQSQRRLNLRFAILG